MGMSLRTQEGQGMTTINDIIVYVGIGLALVAMAFAVVNEGDTGPQGIQGLPGNIIANGSVNSLAWNRSGTDVILANTGDKVGIGTASPGEALDVTGNIAVSGTVDGIDIAARDHTESHTVASHNDTTGTGAELNTLTDNSMADALHRHSELSASDGSPDKIVYTDSDGTLFVDATGTGLDVLHSATIGNHLIVGDDLTVDTNTLFVDSTTKRVGIGTISPGVKLHVIGDTNITGNVTAENAFLPQYIFTHTNFTIPVNGLNLWTNVTFEQEESDLKQGITHNNTYLSHIFGIIANGVYNLHYDADVEDTSVGSSDIDVAGRFIFANGTEVPGSVHEVDIIKKGVEVDLTYPSKAILHAGDEIIFQIVATNGNVQISTHGTFGEHPESASVIIDKVANLP